jgi:hypothetical protein
MTTPPAVDSHPRSPRLSGRGLGALIGAIAGLVFILINAGALPRGWSLGLRGAGTTLFVAVLWVSVLRRDGEHPDQPSPTAPAWRVYWSMVAFEVVLLTVGVHVLTRLGRPELTVPWVALIVGVHFLPFARAFGAAVFRVLGLVLIVLAALGGCLAVLVGQDAGTLTAGVGSGIALLGFAFHARPRVSLDR